VQTANSSGRHGNVQGFVIDGANAAGSADSSPAGVKKSRNVEPVGRNLADVAALGDGGTAWKRPRPRPRPRRKVGERTAAGGRKKIARDCIIGDGAMVLMQLVGGRGRRAWNGQSATALQRQGPVAVTYAAAD
jgi:hypothetical protein